LVLQWPKKIQDAIFSSGIIFMEELSFYGS